MGDCNPRDDAGCQQPDEHGGNEMNRTSMGTMRYLFFGVGLVGGLILLAAGQTLIGGLLVGMGMVRIVMVGLMERGVGASAFHAPRVDGWPGGGGPNL